MLINAYGILELLRQRVVEYASTELVNATSIDVTLGSEILVEAAPFTVDDLRIDLSKHQSLPTKRVVIPEEGFILEAGAFVLAHTQQIFNLPRHISAEYKLKSSMARIGIDHLNAGWCDPGWHGSSLTLELKNVTRAHDIVLHRGDRIGQVVFFSHEHVGDDYAYDMRGRYNNDKTVSGAKVPVQLTLPCCEDGSCGNCSL
jgi:dCTP deaminase